MNSDRRVFRDDGRRHSLEDRFEEEIELLFFFRISIYSG